MGDWIYYNIFRFECLIQAIFYYPAYVLFERPLVSDISDTRDKYDVFRERLTEALKSGRGNSAARITGMTAVWLLLIPWNLIVAFFQIKSKSIWLSGYAIASVIAIVVLLTAGRSGKYFNDFKKIELKSQTRLNRSIFAAFMITVGIWSMFIFSFIYSLQHSII